MTGTHRFAPMLLLAGLSSINVWALEAPPRSNRVVTSSDEEATTATGNPCAINSPASPPSFHMIHMQLGGRSRLSIAPYRNPKTTREKPLDIVFDDKGRIRAVGVSGNAALNEFSEQEYSNFLTTIQIANCDLRKAELGFLRQVIKDQRLEMYFWNCVLTEKSLSWLQKDMRIERISLSHCSKVNDNLEYISRLPDVSYLNLEGTNVKDAGLKQVEQMKKINWLILCDTNVTARGIDRVVQSLPNLETLNVDLMEHITVDDVHRWRSLRPNLDIYCNGK